MKRIGVVVSISVLIVIAIGCGGGGGGGSAPSTPTGITVDTNPSPKHPFFTIGNLLAAGPSGVPITIYCDDAYTVSVGSATLVASGRADNAIIRIMSDTGRNSSDCLLYASDGAVSFTSKDAWETTSDVSLPPSGDASSTTIPRFEKINTSIFHTNLVVGTLYYPQNRSKLGVWTIVGGNAETKLVPLISSFKEN